MHFRFGDTGIEYGDEEAKLTGVTFNETSIQGSDAIRTIGNGLGKFIAIDDELKLEKPIGFHLFPNHPNPFNPETTIRFQIPEYNHVTAIVMNILGQEVRTLANKNFEAGIHNIIWDGKDNFAKDVSSGMYFYQIEAGEFKCLKNMVLIR